MTILIHTESNARRSGKPRTTISKMYGPGLVADRIRLVDPTPAQIVAFANRPIPISIRGRQANLAPYLL